MMKHKVEINYEQLKKDMSIFDGNDIKFRQLYEEIYNSEIITIISATNSNVARHDVALIRFPTHLLF
jgi:hypothetical protein